METETTEYGLIDVDEFVRAKDHEEAFPYTDTNDCESTTESYKKFKRIFPVVYVILNINGQEVKAVIDGWRYVMFARAAGIKEIYACKLNVHDKDEVRAIMIQLARTNHQTYLALYYMILALWDKHWRGQGYRSDIKEGDVDLDTPVLGPDGRRATLYDRVAEELAIKPYKVRYIKVIGDVHKGHFRDMETERQSLHQVFLECNRVRKGILPEPPAAKPAVFHTTSTGTQQYSPPASTGNPDTKYEYRQPVEGEVASGDAVTGAIPLGAVVSVDDEFVTIRVTCFCNREIILKIFKKDIK